MFKNPFVLLDFKIYKGIILNDRLHEIIGKIGILHNHLIENKKINNANEVLEYIKNYEKDVQNHYLNLLLQYYFQQNDLKNFKQLLLVGAKFDIRFEDVKDAFLNIKSKDENVIEFMEDSIKFIKENIDINHLKDIYEYYKNNPNLHDILESVIKLIRKNRYVCLICAKNPDSEYGEFFLNKDLLESLKRDLPYLFK